MRLRSTITGLALFAMAVTAWAALPAPETPDAAAPLLKLSVKRGGAGLEIRTSRSDRPILSATGLVPGATATGQVTVANVGEQALLLRIASRNVADAPGLNGGRLSDALRVQITQIARRSPTATTRRTLYSGSLARLGRQRVAALAPRTRRTYYFRVGLPDGGIPETRRSGDNRYQGATAAVDFVWIGRARR